MAAIESKQSNPRASTNCRKEMIRVRFQAVFYIPDAWSGDDHVANKSNHAKRVMFYSACVKQQSNYFIIGAWTKTIILNQ